MNGGQNPRIFSVILFIEAFVLNDVDFGLKCSPYGRLMKNAWRIHYKDAVLLPLGFKTSEITSFMQ